MTDKKIEYLADHANDTKYTDMPTMLTQVLEEYDSGDRTAKQGVFISLENDSGEYYTRFCAVGMKCSEVVALMEYMKDEMLRIMKDPL